MECQLQKKAPPRRGVPDEKGGSGGSFFIQQFLRRENGNTRFTRHTTDNHSRR
jgi:hypothetical protein